MEINNLLRQQLNSRTNNYQYKHTISYPRWLSISKNDKYQLLIEFSLQNQSIMKKKSERYSYNKLTTSKKKIESQPHQQLKILLPRSNSKQKSTGKNLFNETSYKLKLNKNLLSDKKRIKTQTDQHAMYKQSYRSHLPSKRKQYNKYEEKIGKLIPQAKQKNMKKLRINHDAFDCVKNLSLEKINTPQHIKHHSFRKVTDSGRSANKKTALQRYISESLENLEHIRHKRRKDSSKQTSTGRLSKKKGDQTLIREKRMPSMKERKVFEDTTKQIHHEDQHKRYKTQRDEHYQKRQKTIKNIYNLSRQELQTFGDRFPEGFEKIKVLGRGGFALVWLGEHKKSKKKYAIKQIITESSHQTHIKQIWFGTYFFEFGGAVKQEFRSHPGINNLVKLHYYFINKKDTWILYEKCGASLGSTLYELRAEMHDSEQLHRIYHKEYYVYLRQNQNEIRKLILEIARALQLLSENNIVHSDIKADNILVRLKSTGQIDITSSDFSLLGDVKLIDYGSSFLFNNLRQFSMATPQYMAPEILNFILHQNNKEYIPQLLDYVKEYNRPWCIDVWSLGSVILEIVSGIPLWMSLKTIVHFKDSQLIRLGLFAVKGRIFQKIIGKQIEVVQNLDYYLNHQNYSGIYLEEDLRILLKKMLMLNPKKRISPTEIIQFLEGSSPEEEVRSV